MSCNNIFKAVGGCITLILTHTGESESSLSQIPGLSDTFFSIPLSSAEQWAFKSGHNK